MAVALRLGDVVKPGSLGDMLTMEGLDVDLVQKAHNFIQNGRQEELKPLLKELVVAATQEALFAVRMLYEDMYGGFTYNYFFKAPFAFCLPAWGNEGLKALVEGAKRTPKSKNISLTLEILSSLSSGHGLPQLTNWVNDEEITQLVQIKLSRCDNISSAARQMLNEYILWFEDEDEMASAVTSCMDKLTHMVPIDVPKQLFAALATRWMVISKPILDNYRELIVTHSDDEVVFQEFFEKHPQLLDPMALQVWPKPDLHGFKEPDFIVRRTDNTYLIVEIETPGKMLITNDNQISALVTQAVSQAMHYRTFLLERYQEAQKFFPEFQDPDTLVIIGQEQLLNNEKRKVLLMENQHRNKVQIVGFDWLAKRANTITSNMIEKKLEVHKLRMV